MTINRDKFFPRVRQELFGGVLRQSQVDGLTAILDEWERRYPAGDLRWLSYELATTVWETAHSMQPIDEYGGHAYFQRMYDVQGERPEWVRANLGNVYPGDGILFHGRGFVMLTGRRNYQKAGGLVGVDLVKSPERAKEPAIAAAILFEGMEHGLFTGRGLPLFFAGGVERWNDARSIINGDGDVDHNGVPDSVDIGNLGRVLFAVLQESTLPASCPAPAGGMASLVTS
jgi:putative chitinase